MADGGTLDLALHERQTSAYLSDATEILYGGAAGGGKSHLMRVASIMWCAQIPGLQVYIFRRQFPDLYKNHMEGPTSFVALLGPWLQSKLAKFNGGKNFFEFWNGSKIHLCHCQHEKDKVNYQGAEIHVLIIDEVTHFSESMYRYLRGRVRIAGLPIPEQYSGTFPRVLCGTNPGGVGHNWVKAAWINGLKPFDVAPQPASEGGLRRQYIPAKLADNPTMRNDPDYADRLAGLGNPALVKAMMEGDWNIVSGGALDDVWSPRVIVPRFKAPISWMVDRSFDWGSSHPFSVLWWAESDGTEARLPDGTVFCPPRGSLVLTHEWYGAAKPNVGLKMAPKGIAAGILEREAALLSAKWIENKPKPGPADNQISAVTQSDTLTIARSMAAAGVHWTESDKSPGSRKIGLDLIRERLTEAGKDRPESPALYVMEHCRNAIDHWPVLPRDPDNTDDVDTKAEDHDYDALRYRALQARRTARIMPLPI